MMEQRVFSREARFDRIAGKLDMMGETLADIRVDLAKKPSLAALWGMIATVLGLALAISFGILAVAEWVASRAAG